MGYLGFKPHPDASVRQNSAREKDRSLRLVARNKPPSSAAISKDRSLRPVDKDKPQSGFYRDPVTGHFRYIPPEDQYVSDMGYLGFKPHSDASVRQNSAREKDRSLRLVARNKSPSSAAISKDRSLRPVAEDKPQSGFYRDPATGHFRYIPPEDQYVSDMGYLGFKPHPDASIRQNAAREKDQLQRHHHLKRAQKIIEKIDQIGNKPMTQGPQVQLRPSF